MSRPLGDPTMEDLTARARIRDAALRLFAERGIDGATIRDIAKAAGVSAGLVRHHFGSKEDLRDACDSYALDQVMSIKTQATREGFGANPAFLPGVHPTLLLMMRYFARSMVDGSPASARLFDRMVVVTEQWLKDNHPGLTKDPRALAAVIVAMQTGQLAMHQHLSRAMGTDVFTPPGHFRLGMALVDVYSHPLLDPELAAQAHVAYERMQAAHTHATEQDGPRQEEHDDD